MANSLDPIFPKILARALILLRRSVKMPRLVRTDYSAEAAKQGDVINVSLPIKRDADDVTPQANQPTPTDRTHITTPVELSQWKSADFYLTDREKRQVMKDELFIPVEMNEALDAISRSINGYIFSKYHRIGGHYGNGGAGNSLLFDDTLKFSRVAAVRRALNEQDCFDEDRNIVLTFDAEEAAIQLSEFSDASKSSDAGPIINGEIGRKLGFRWFADYQVPTHTSGTGTGYVVNNGAGYPKGYTGVIVVGTGTGGMLHGDVLKFAGHNIGYSVKSLITDTQLTLYQPLAEAIVDTEVITNVIQPHDLNIAFHPSAWAFASRTLVDDDDRDISSMITMTDPITQIALRLEKVRQHKQTKWEFDVLFGAELVQPGCAARILANS